MLRDRTRAGMLTILMHQPQHPSDVLAPLPEAQFGALRLWAMNFGTYRPIGVASWPFSYTPAQEQRMRAIVAVVPQRQRLGWTLLVAIAWFIIGFSMGFIPLIPFIAAPASQLSSLAAQTLLLVGIFANLMSAYVAGSVFASWVGGRMFTGLAELPPLDQAAGDAELLARIRGKIARVSIFAVLSALEPLLISILR